MDTNMKDMNETMEQIRSMRRKDLIKVFEVNRAKSQEHWMHFTNYGKKSKTELRGILTDIYFRSIPIYLPVSVHISRIQIDEP